MSMTLATLRMMNSMMPIIWTVTLVIFRPMSTSNNLRILGLPGADHHRIRVIPHSPRDNPLKPCLSIQQWHSLQPEAHVTWDLLSNEAKAIILGLCKDPGKHVVNLHNISVFDFLQANLHESLLEETEDPVEIPRS